MDTHSSQESSNTLTIATSNSNTSGMARFRLVVLGIGTVMAGLLIVGILPRLHRNAELNASAQEAKSDVLTVNTVTPHRADAKAELTLPGNIQAVQETTIYSRMDGYLKNRLADIGDRVDAGQLLAEIDSPEVDRELDQARANLAQARSAYAQAVANLEQARSSAVQVQTNSNFARISSDRWNELQQQGAVSRQDFDEKRAAYDASAANVKAAKSVINANQSSVESAMANISASAANVERLEAMRDYKRITAPFNGVITARNVETGALITAGSGGSNAVWLYKIAQPGTLRIFVNLPQTYVESVHAGQPADILVREFPKRVFSGKVTRTSSALDTNSHTLLTEVQVNNSDLKLLPGMYAQVQFTLRQTTLPLIVPASAIAVRSEGSQVAVVGADQKVHYQTITIGRDYGTEVEILSGLQGNEQLIVNPTDEISEGRKVHAVAVKSKEDK